MLVRLSLCLSLRYTRPRSLVSLSLSVSLALGRCVLTCCIRKTPIFAPCLKLLFSPLKLLHQAQLHLLCLLRSASSLALAALCFTSLAFSLAFARVLYRLQVLLAVASLDLDDSRSLVAFL